jgi:hypothetical protein
MRPPPPLSFTSIVIAGNNGAGPIKLSGGTVIGPFAPEQGDLVTSILTDIAVVTPFTFDDKGDFASEVGVNDTLLQVNAGNLSGTFFLISFARQRP